MVDAYFRQNAPANRQIARFGSLALHSPVHWWIINQTPQPPYIICFSITFSPWYYSWCAIL